MEQTNELRQAVSDYRAGRAEAFTAIYEMSNRYIYTCIHVHFYRTQLSG